MKKNAMLKIAAILMVAVLLTTCAISSTFAKYTTTKEATSTARVAKWGVEFDADVFVDNLLFNNEYGDAEDPATTNTKHVKAGSNVVAPGTSASLDLDSVVSGTPEVSGFVQITTTIELNDTWLDEDGNFYCPLVFNVNGTEVEGKNFTSEADLKAALTDALVEKKYFDAQKSVNDAIEYSIEWEWPISVNDAADTYLANYELNGVAAPEVEIVISITIEQQGPAVA